MRTLGVLLAACSFAIADTNPRQRGFDPLTCRQVISLGGGQGRVPSLSFSPDGRFLAMAGQDGMIRICSVSSPGVLRTLDGSGGVTSVLYSPDGKSLLALTHRGRTLSVFDPSSGERRREFANAGGRAGGVAISPDSKRVAVVHRDRRCRLYDLAEGTELQTLESPDGRILSVAFSGDGRRVVTAGGDRMIRSWEAENGAEAWCSPPLPATVSSMAVHPKEGRLAALLTDGTLALMDLSNGAEQASLKTEIRNGLALVFHRNGRWMAAADRTGKVFFFDSATGKEIRQFEAHRSFVWSLQFSPDGRWLATSGEDGKVHLWGGTSAAGKAVLKSVRKEGKPGYLGVSVDAGGNDDESLILLVVSPGTAADKAGLQVGDEILSISGKTLASFEELREMVTSFVEGDEVEVKYRRHGAEATVKVTLGSRPDE